MEAHCAGIACFGFMSGPAAFVGGVPLTRAKNPGEMPEASTERPVIFPRELIPFSDVKVAPGKSKVKKLFGGTKKSPCVTPEASAYLPTTQFLLLSPNRIVATEPGGSIGKCSVPVVSR